MTRVRIDLLAWLVTAAIGCVDESTALTLATPDRVRFDQEVYPVLLRDCGFHACHGSTERFFQVFGPGRGRLDVATTKPLDAATDAERLHSYERARSMLDVKAPESSLLLRKPLAVAAGGAGHEGADELGRNVYQSKTELGYAALERWVLGIPARPP